MDNIYRAVWPFVELQGMGLTAIILWSEVGTWPPDRMLR